jgi:hypothetical protein
LEFPGDDVTDDDIGSIMEQLNQLAGSTGKFFFCSLIVPLVVLQFFSLVRLCSVG